MILGSDDCGLFIQGLSSKGPSKLMPLPLKINLSIYLEVQMTWRLDQILCLYPEGRTLINKVSDSQEMTLTPSFQ